MTFQEVMASNIRPKCEPVITVSGTDIDGNTHTVVWKAKDIKSLTFKQSIDPLGRNLPIMELQWTEVYYGKFNAQNFPIKYNNIAKYMSVTLEFEQSTSFYRTWKDVKSTTWKNVLSNTWKSLKSDVPKTTITMPIMFLSANPEISGKTIKWTAKDALSFLTEKQTKAFYDVEDTSENSIPFYNPISYLLINARATYYHSKELFDYYTRTINYFNSLDKTKLLTHGVIFDGATNSEIMNYLSPLNEYLYFGYDKIMKKEFTGTRTEEPLVNIPLKLQYGTPTVETCTPVSRYAYNQYKLVVNHESYYEMSPSNVELWGTKTVDGTETSFYKLDYYFNGYGTTRAFGEELSMAEEINRAVEISSDVTLKAKVAPIDHTCLQKEVYISKNVGEIYNEDNKLNVYDESEVTERANRLKNWFSSENHVIKNKTPAMFNWDLGEFANCETLLYNDDGTSYVAPAMLVECTIEYNGAIKQSNVAHEIKGVS